MIDIHFHCLPGIDDGPSTWEEAVDLCRAAGAEGTETIVATPHVLRDPWLNEDRAERDRLLVRLNALLGGKPAVVPGCGGIRNRRWLISGRWREMREVAERNSARQPRTQALHWRIGGADFHITEVDDANQIFAWLVFRGGF